MESLDTSILKPAACHQSKPERLYSGLSAARSSQSMDPQTHVHLILDGIHRTWKWVKLACLQQSQPSCHTSRHKLWFHLPRPWYAADSVTALTRPFACLKRWQICLSPCGGAWMSLWIGFKRSFRSRPACYVSWRCYAATATAATNRSVWRNDIRSHLPFGPSAADDESRQWRCAHTHCAQARTEFLGRPRQTRCFVHHICVTAFDHGSSVDVHRCVIWAPGYV